MELQDYIDRQWEALRERLVEDDCQDEQEAPELNWDLYVDEEA